MEEQIRLILSKIPLVRSLWKSLVRKKNIFDFTNLVKNQPPIFVYQMGKVASSSTYQSIKDQYSGACLHSHSFTTNHDKLYVKTLFELLQKEKLKIKIISMVREPISRNISAFFENFKRDTGITYSENQYSIEELKEIFLSNYNHAIPIVWFDNNIKKNFGIDIYKSPFPEKGYDFYKNDNVELLLFKHDIKDTIKEKIVGDFVGIESFRLTNVNVGEEKEYASTYKEFKKLSLPECYLDDMLSSKYATHFYSKDLAEIRERWTKATNNI